MCVSGLLATLSTPSLTNWDGDGDGDGDGPDDGAPVHGSGGGRSRRRARHGRRSQRDLSTKRDGRGRGLTTTQNNQRPNAACCFCWCCCCSCSWNEEERRRRRRRRKRISQDTKMEIIPNCEACTKPSVEEIRLWSQSFDKLMRNPAGRNVFREFLRTEYSEENMLFWLACEDLKQEPSKSSVEEKARSIYEDYISILSPKEVSLDARVREVINRKMQEPTPHTFEDAQLQIYTLMHRDSYPRFLSSSIYRVLVQAGSRSSSES